MPKIINISEATSIAIHSLAYIAGSERWVNATEIAEKSGFSRNHVAKVLQIFTKHKFLTSERGPSGGFKLNKEAGKISLLNIYEIMEGKVEVTKCGMHYNKCNFNTCVYGDVLTRVSEEVIGYFRKRTLKDVMKDNLKI